MRVKNIYIPKPYFRESKDGFRANEDQLDLKNYIKNCSAFGANKVIRFLMTQSGTSAPTLTMLYNNSGATITTEYNNVGDYNIVSNIAIFTENKLYVEFTPFKSDTGDFTTNAASKIDIQRVSDTTLRVFVKSGTDLLLDNLLLYKPVTIYIY